MNETILDAREKRWNKKCKLAVETGLTVVTVTVNAPAGCKASNFIVEAHEIIVKRLVSALHAHDINPNHVSLNYGADGPECYLTIEGDPYEIKKICIEQESLPGGRIADIDVMREDTVIVSRRDMGICDRKCFLCSNSARDCIIEKRHSLKEITDMVVLLAMEVIKSR